MKRGYVSSDKMFVIDYDNNKVYFSDLLTDCRYNNSDYLLDKTLSVVKRKIFDTLCVKIGLDLYIQYSSNQFIRFYLDESNLKIHSTRILYLSNSNRVRTYYLDDLYRYADMLLIRLTISGSGVFDTVLLIIYRDRVYYRTSGYEDMFLYTRSSLSSPKFTDITESLIFVSANDVIRELIF